MLKLILRELFFFVCLPQFLQIFDLVYMLKSWVFTELYMYIKLELWFFFSISGGLIFYKQKFFIFNLYRNVCTIFWIINLRMYFFIFTSVLSIKKNRGYRCGRKQHFTTPSKQLLKGLGESYRSEILWGCLVPCVVSKKKLWGRSTPPMLPVWPFQCLFVYLCTI